MDSFQNKRFQRTFRLLSGFLLVTVVVAYVFLSHSSECACNPGSTEKEKKNGDASILEQFTKFDITCGQRMKPEAIRDAAIKKFFRGKDPFKAFPPKHLAEVLGDDGYMHGWGSTAEVFAMLMNEVKPRVVIEIGTFLGASATHMANISREIGTQDALFLCIDDFRGWPGFLDDFRVKEVNGDVMLLQHFMQNIIQQGHENNILPVPFSTSHALTALCSMGVMADLIEVDAGHDFRSAWSDINLAYHLLAPKGVMFGHDYKAKADKRGVGRAVNLFAKLHNLRVETSDKHWILRPM